MSRTLLNVICGVVIVSSLFGQMAFEKLKGTDSKTIQVSKVDRAISLAGLRRDEVIYNGKEQDVNQDGIPDYHCEVKQPDGTYTPKIILGVAD